MEASPMTQQLSEITVTKPVDVILHQCSACGCVGTVKVNITRHVETKCPGARVLTGSVAMVPATSTLAPATSQISIDGDHNRVHSHDVHVHIEKIYVGSEAEKQRLFELLRSQECVQMLSVTPAHEIPGRLFQLFKGGDAPPELRNIRVQGDKVRELRAPGQEVAMSRSKFVKKTVSDMLGVVDAVLPDSTPAPEIVQETQRDLRASEFGLGAKRKVSKLEAARLQSSNCPDKYRLDANGRAFLDKANSGVDKELAYYKNV